MSNTKCQPNSICPVCENPFYLRPNLANKPSKIPRTCSKKCYGVLRAKIGFVQAGKGTKIKQGQEFPCAYCGEATYKNPSQIAKSTNQIFYCSIECQGKAKEVERVPNSTCAYCGVPFFKHPAEKKRPDYSNLDFCGNACSTSYRNSRMIFNRTPNGLESDFLRDFPELQFTGNGSLWIHDQQGGMNPDFRLPHTDKLIELFGNYWHEGEDSQERINRFKEAGWLCIVIWENDYRLYHDHIIHLVTNFLNG